MRKCVLSLMTGVAGLALAATAASAADLPVREAPPAPFIAPAPVFTWSGFYVGVNAGYGWSDEDTGRSIFVPGGAIGVGSPAGTLTFGDEDAEGFVGGGQVGYNMQFGAFVVGVEADLQWADLGADRGEATFPAAWDAFAFRPAGVAGGIDWFGTVRAKAGVAFGQALVYATGGFAYGGGDTDDEFDGIFDNGVDDDVRTGWVVGLGAEYAFTNNLTFGIEGLWVNLEGDDDSTFIGSSVPAPGADREAVFVEGAEQDNDADFFVARAKLNFKFGTF